MNTIAYRIQHLIPSVYAQKCFGCTFLGGKLILFHIRMKIPLVTSNFDFIKIHLQFQRSCPRRLICHRILFHKFGVHILSPNYGCTQVWHMIKQVFRSTWKYSFLLRSPVPLRLPNYLNHSFCKKNNFVYFLTMKIQNHLKSKNTMIKGVVKNRAQPQTMK